MRLAQIPPTVAPPTGRAILGGLAAALRLGRHEGTLAREVRELIPTERVVTFGSGRAALAEAIGLARRITGRDRVVIPAYTSFSVAAAVTAADAVAELCDVDPTTLAMDRSELARLVDDRTAAVVLGNLYGFPEPTRDLDWITARGALVIDDAAQALGAFEGEHAAGSRGQLGVLSFGRGKCVSTGDGGALLVHDPRLLSEVRDLDPSPNPAAGFGIWAVAVALVAAAHPSMFGVLSRLPGTRVGESWYEPEFEVGPAPLAVDGLAIDLANAVGRHAAIRRSIAELWHASLSGIAGLRLVRAGPDIRPAHLRVPVFLEDPERRPQAVARLRRVGFGHVGSYPHALGRIPAFRSRVGSTVETLRADCIARGVIALPCNIAVKDNDVERAARALSEAMTQCTQ